MASSDELWEPVAASHMQHLCTIAAAVVLVYDTLLTFNDEIMFIWRRKLGVISIVYFVNRYVEILAYIADIQLLFPLNISSPNYLIDLTPSPDVRLLEYIRRFFSGYRTYALSGPSKLLAILVFVLTATYIVPDMYQYSHTKHFIEPYPYNCRDKLVPSTVLLPCEKDSLSHVPKLTTTIIVLLGSRASTLLGEAIVIAITLKKTYRLQRASSYSDDSCLHPLVRVLLSNSILCFSVPLIFNVLVTVLSLVENPVAFSVGQSLAAFRDSLSSILVSRFLLDIGKLSVDGSSNNVDGLLSTHVVSDFSGVTYTLDFDQSTEGLEQSDYA
ncbi:hypothetical protein C8Q74DRAFT_1222327 [Fomes fomentarius]|nr:hypothetical protein C8Q74DRAFT_1222327 [Fomes fomentarius]